MAAAAPLLRAPPDAGGILFRCSSLAKMKRNHLLQRCSSLSSPSNLKQHLRFKEKPSSSSPSASAELQCPHFESCSGCTIERDLDRPVVIQEVSDFFKRHGVADFTFESSLLRGWRCRAKLAVRGTAKNPLIGLYEEGSHNVVDIPFCRAHHPSINAAIEILRQGISLLNILPYEEDSRAGELRYVQMAVTTYNTSLPLEERYNKGKVQVALVWNSSDQQSESHEKLNCLSHFLWKKGGCDSDYHLIHSVWANFQTSTCNVIFGGVWKFLTGDRDFWERIGGIDVYLDPSSFGQANTQAFDSLLRRLQNYVPYGSSVVDFYAGAGIIGLSVAVTRKSRSLRCIENNNCSKLSFQKTLTRIPKTLDCSIKWHNTDASNEPLHWLKGSDVVIVDPPRKGLDCCLVDALRLIALSDGITAKGFRRSIQKMKDEKRPWVLRAREGTVHMGSNGTQETCEAFPQTLIYISCGWKSFTEDCMRLLSGGAWHLEKAHAFNFFPGSQSIEVLAVFKKGPGAVNKKKKKELKSKAS